jgi:pimeloyl-ACP methyl ester carboxylesterase
MAEDVSMLIDEMQLGKVYVLGASMGGMIAQLLRRNILKK